MKRFGLIKRYSIEKSAGDIKDMISIGGAAAKIGVGIVLTGAVIKQIIDKINNDANKKRIIEDIALNDPTLKSIDKKKLMEWYATINYYAPTLANDKHTVSEVLRQFAMFGKIDINTLKMLADTEKSVSATHTSSIGLSDLVRFV